MTMLRGAPIAYSSVPQDEGSSRDQTSIMTRPPGNSHTRCNCQLSTAIISLVIVTAISLAVILPLILKDRAVASGRDQLLGQPIEAQDKLSSAGKITELPEGNINNTTEQKPVLPNSLAGYDTKNSSVDGRQPSTTQSNTTEKENSIPEKSTPKPVIPTTTTDEITTARATTTTARAITTAPATTIVITPKTTALPSSTAAKPTGEGKPASSAIPNMGDEGQGTAGETQFASPGASKQNVTKADILNAIYGSGDSSVKPGTTYSWMNNMMAEHDVPTLVVLAVVVAVAGAAVVAALAWLVYGRISARRRRINIQSVITDLQSRDKIVLLNSEESEEE